MRTHVAVRPLRGAPRNRLAAVRDLRARSEAAPPRRADVERGIWLLLALGAALAAWTWATRARERADAVSREVCSDLGVQRLDESVTLRYVSLARTAQGLRVRRVFSFEFSTNGADRRRGDVCLLGAALAWVRIDHPDGPIFVDRTAGDG